MQLTGFYNYKRLSDHLKDEQIITQGHTYVAKAYPFTSAGFWWQNNNMNTLCNNIRHNASIEEAVRTVTRRVNGGTNGLADRIKYYKKATEIIR